MKDFSWLILMAILISCSDSGDGRPSETENLNAGHYSWVHSVHTTLGVPFDSDTTNDYIIVRPQYVLSYNNSQGGPNWVSWEMNTTWFGDVDRWSGNFITDTSLPISFYRVKHSDYTNSGYDRGHQVRSEERTATIEDNKSTFLMTNILPQTPDLNQGVWLKFEYYLEKLCKEQNKELFVIAGGIYESGTRLSSSDKVAVPDSCWKIVVVLNPGQTLKDVTESTLVLAVCMPNIAGIRNDDISKYYTTIDDIEMLTGYDFLSEIEDGVERVIERVRHYK